MRALCGAGHKYDDYMESRDDHKLRVCVLSSDRRRVVLFVPSVHRHRHICEIHACSPMCVSSSSTRVFVNNLFCEISWARLRTGTQPASQPARGTAVFCTLGAQGLSIFWARFNVLHTLKSTRKPGVGKRKRKTIGCARTLLLLLFCVCVRAYA